MVSSSNESVHNNRERELQVGMISKLIHWKKIKRKINSKL